jgi:putative ABC transport system permease protein
MKWFDAARVRLRLLFADRAAESRMNEEFRLHLEMEADQLAREEGLAPDEARRRAMVRFGGVEQHKEALRDDRGFAWLRGLTLDLKLGARILARYPGLTLVGGAAMAFGIGAGVGAFELRTQLVNPSLPLDEGSKIVGLRIWNASLNRADFATATDVETWRVGLRLVTDVSAFTAFDRNLITDDGRSGPEAAAAMSASAFRVTRVAPLFGRTLTEADDTPGAPPVVVIGHDVWKRRFESDPGVIGQTVRLGIDLRTVVGVMPEGFTFPARQELWIPLQRDAAASAPGEEPELLVFGRLGPGASRRQAQAELDVMGVTARTGSGEGRAQLRPQLVQFSRLLFDSQDIRIGLVLGNAFVVMLLLLVCANVALLMFARTATRETEIAVRSALGAARVRIVIQLFLEALVLAGVAVVIGIAAARVGVRSLLATLEADSGRPLPFWISGDLAPTTVLYAGALMILGAAIIGVLPALKMTGGGHQARLRQSTAGGGGVRFGGVWTAVIAAQVAATVLFPAGAFFFHRWVVAGRTLDVGFPADRYVSARLDVDRERAPGVALDATEPAFRSRITRTYTELERRLRSEAAVTGLTFADRLPGTGHPLWRIDVEGDRSASGVPAVRPPAASASVALNFFDELGAPMLAGRSFTTADLGSSVGVVIVNQSFVSRVFGGRNPIGRRIRRARVDTETDFGPWLEIVGVVRDLGMVSDAQGAGLYQLLSPEAMREPRVVIGVKGTPESFAPRLRAVAGEVDPTLQVHELMTLRQARERQGLESQYLSRVLVVLSAIALSLSLTAIYSVTAFTVSRRTREIGIRVALGADARRVVGPLLRRPLAQVCVGIGAGTVLVAVADVVVFQSTPSPSETVLIGAYAFVILGICLLACFVPASRALRTPPGEVLRANS